MMTFASKIVALDPFGLGRKRQDRSKVEPRMAMIHLRRIEACRAKIQASMRERDEAIREAWAQGETMRDIAKYAGMSHQRVQQIIREGRD